MLDPFSLHINAVLRAQKHQWKIFLSGCVAPIFYFILVDQLGFQNLETFIFEKVQYTQKYIHIFI